MQQWSCVVSSLLSSVKFKNASIKSPKIKIKGTQSTLVFLDLFCALSSSYLKEKAQRSLKYVYQLLAALNLSLCILLKNDS